MELLGEKFLGFSANPLEAPLGPLGISGPFENHWFSPPTHNFTALFQQQQAVVFSEKPTPHYLLSTKHSQQQAGEHRVAFS